MYKRDIERSRFYYYGEGEEFLTRDEAMRQAAYKLNAMIAELGIKELDGNPEIKDYGQKLRVEIPVKWKTIYD